MTLDQRAAKKAKQLGKKEQTETTALFLLQENMEISKVAKATSLSIDIVARLAEKIKKAH